MQAFGATGLSSQSRWHFDYFYDAMLTVFNVFTGGWVDAFQACTVVTGVKISGVFFVSCLIVGFFVILNLFVAILLEAFAEGDEEEDDEDEQDKGGNEESKTDDIADIEGGQGGEAAEPPSTPLVGEVAISEPPASPSSADAENMEILDGMSLGVFAPDHPFRVACHTLVTNKVFDTFIIILIVVSSACLALDVPRLDPTSDLKANLDLANYFFTAVFITEMLLKIVTYGFLFEGPKAYLRQPWNILDFMIVCVSILGLLAKLVPAFGRLKALRILRVLRPLRLLQRNPGMKLIITSLLNTLPVVADVFLVVIVFHIIFAIIGMMMFSGMFGSCTDESITTRAECVEPPARRLLLAARLPDADSIGRLDAINHSLEWSDALTAPGLLPATPHTPLPSAAPLAEEGPHGAEEASDAAASKRRRLARARAKYAKRKEMNKASYRDPAAREQRLRERERRKRGRELKGGGGGGMGGDGEMDEDTVIEWLNPAFGSFDNFGESMLILYVASTGDGWEEFMWAGMDARGVGIAPERNDHSMNAFYFIAWMFVGMFVALNLFVGAIVDNFTRIKAEAEGSATMTPEQQQWKNAMMGSHKPDRAPRAPLQHLRRSAFHLIHSKPFEFVMMSVIGLNVFAMALEYEGMENDPVNAFAYHVAMLAFTYIYFVEFALKFFAMGCNYFADSWCQFDFFLVCVSALDLFAKQLLEILPIPPTMLRVLRVARVLRILRLLKNLKGLRDLVMTLVLSSPALANVGALLGIVMFMYSVLGMNLLTYVQHGDDLNDHNNFESFGAAMLLLFQCLTGDGWSAMMDDAMINEDRGCDPAPDDGSPSDCGSPLALPFFISYMIIGAFIFLNLVVAVILENFTALGNVNPDLVSASDINDFKEVWGEYDPDANGLIPTKELPSLVMILRAPLGLKDSPLLNVDRPHQRAMRFCLSLGLTQQEGQVAFKDVLDALMKQNYASKAAAVGSDGQETKEPPTRDPTMKGLPIAVIGSGAPIKVEPLTPRRREFASIFAEELLSDFMKRRRESGKMAIRPSTEADVEARRRARKEMSRKHVAVVFGGEPAAAVAAPESAPLPAPEPLPEPTSTESPPVDTPPTRSSKTQPPSGPGSPTGKPTIGTAKANAKLGANRISSAAAANRESRPPQSARLERPPARPPGGRPAGSAAGRGSGANTARGAPTSGRGSGSAGNRSLPRPAPLPPAGVQR